ncbi:MAG TPA: AbrB/MazE/SpoVT family DNA-binding domain-containing protein [Jatrophihabitantaceae bacterium]|nr:AbrB/MazE/SpoVT family DNA-binding domain-containing protein [Jatrophihabitantaceae bacterium]
MHVSIDAAGRVVIPQAVRRRLGLDPGTRLDIDEVDGAVVVRPVNRVTIATGDDGLPILRVPADAAALTRDDVRRVLEESREWPRR